jgi:hypothetical protein
VCLQPGAAHLGSATASRRRLAGSTRGQLLMARRAHRQSCGRHTVSKLYNQHQCFAYRTPSRVEPLHAQQYLAHYGSASRYLCKALTTTVEAVEAFKRCNVWTAARAVLCTQTTVQPCKQVAFCQSVISCMTAVTDDIEHAACSLLYTACAQTTR